MNEVKLLEQLTINNRNRHNLRRFIPTLSLIVVLFVFWSLKLTGIGIAGEAFCGKEEHIHNEECTRCTLEEHIHTSDCYSDITADLETEDDWEATLGDIARGPTTKSNVVLVAKSQLGYTESTLNFQVDLNGVRRGITRYGQWYGNPYGDWSAMFVSFCLEYAGAMDLPTNAGPESMRSEWEAAGLYKTANELSPEVGNIVFLHKGGTSNSNANSVAIIIGVDNNYITVIEGDLENSVAQTKYAISDKAILGYGIVTEADGIVVLAAAPTAAAKNYTVWLDGTDGGLSFLTGSPNTAYTVQEGNVIKLPTEWTSPSKYSYKLQGWYDISNNKYYPAGSEMTVTGNAVLYADWVAATYDIGEFNAYVADTVSTNNFITTHMFDYNTLFNILSSQAQITVSSSSHSETWSTVNSGTVGYLGKETLNFVFIDGAPNYRNGNLAYSNNRQTHNTYPGAGIVTSGIYNTDRYHALFDPEDSLGKKYLGTGDHLFQIMTDPNDPYYGYYYYDSQRNAASYNQSQGRFYVYEYLEAPSDSVGDTNSGFLPLNSPYANTNGNNTGTYTYKGLNGEYAGVNHFEYGAAYSSSDRVLANYAYGMRTEIRFNLPDNTGTNGNKDLYGNDMHFYFSGDDDVWVLIDGVLVLDIGGIHGVETGEINFATGEVSVQGKVVGTTNIPAGEHVMTVLYLERGASSSNCAIYFNLAPRYSLDIQKEDVLTQELLDGAKFSVYTDAACTVPALLYTSETAYELGETARNTFTVTKGVAQMWGLSPSKTYYIKETSPPTASGYSIPQGIIQLKIDKEGLATYHVEIVGEASPGYTVHGVNINDETKKVYIVVTNAPDSVTDVTTVQVYKVWEDTVNHSSDYIKAYLTVTDPDGTVRRIREITLSDENDWKYTWTNLPKYNYDSLQEVHYGIEESYESGYYSTVRKVTHIEISKTEWAESGSFINGESYILKSNNGYLSTVSNTDSKLTWVNEETAKNSSLATWTVTVSGGKVKFVNGAGQILTFVYNSNSSRRYFYATTSSTNVQTFTPVDADTGFRFYATRNNSSSGTKYYMASSGINNSGQISTTTGSSSGLILTPMKKITQTDVQEIEDWAYQIINTPLPANNETSLSVNKQWVIPDGFDSKLYQEFSVTVRLFANGVNTGRSVTLTLKNNWQGIFQGLPYKDSNGQVIVYTIDEVWEKANWSTEYGEIKTTSGSPPTYSTVITNTYHRGGPELPSTGSMARIMYVLCGSIIILGTLVYAIASRRKQERRTK